MPSRKVSEGRVKYAVKNGKDKQPNIRGLARSLNELNGSVLALTTRIAEMNQRLAQIETRTMALFPPQWSAETFGWLKMAEGAFAFWDNDEDSVYDDL